MFVNLKNINISLNNFSKGRPYDHCIIDNFFENEIAKKLENEFPNYDSDIWQNYNIQILKCKEL